MAQVMTAMSMLAFTEQHQLGVKWTTRKARPRGLLLLGTGLAGVLWVTARILV